MNNNHLSVCFSGIVLCKIVNFCPILVITSSIYTLVGISFERHQVVISENREKKFTFRKLAIQIIFIWGFAIGVSIPTLLEYTVREVPITIGNHTVPTLSCGSQTTRVLALTNAVFVLIVSYIIPGILLTRNYVEVAMFVYRKGKKMRENLEPSGVNISCIRLLKHRTKVVKLLVTVAAIFAVSWLPFFIILIYAVSIQSCKWIGGLKVNPQQTPVFRDKPHFGRRNKQKISKYVSLCLRDHARRYSY